MSIKVTDRRMFTEDGELREGFEPEDEGDDVPAPSPPPSRSESASPVSGSSAPPVQPAAAPRASRGPDAASQGASRPEVDTGEARHPAAQFLEIVGSLVEPATLFLGDAKMPDGQTVEDLERARVYIDLLAVLQEKTQGNLSPEEDSVLGEILYRLRLRYVQKRDAAS